MRRYVIWLSLVALALAAPALARGVRDVSEGRRPAAAEAAEAGGQSWARTARATATRAGEAKASSERRRRPRRGSEGRGLGH